MPTRPSRASADLRGFVAAFTLRMKEAGYIVKISEASWLTGAVPSNYRAEKIEKDKRKIVRQYRGGVICRVSRSGAAGEARLSVAGENDDHLRFELRCGGTVKKLDEINVDVIEDMVKMVDDLAGIHVKQALRLKRQFHVG